MGPLNSSKSFRIRPGIWLLIDLNRPLVWLTPAPFRQYPQAGSTGISYLLHRNGSLIGGSELATWQRGLGGKTLALPTELGGLTASSAGNLPNGGPPQLWGQLQPGQGLSQPCQHEHRDTVHGGFNGEVAPPPSPFATSPTGHPHRHLDGEEIYLVQTGSIFRGTPTILARRPID